MKLSVKGDYAARAVLSLAKHHHAGTVRRVEDIAAEQNIPAAYLVQILIELKSKHIVKSVRGKVGGYLLARPPAEITLGDILRCIHGQVFDPPGATAPNSPPELRAAWKSLQNAVDQTADSIDFQRLLDASPDRQKMYYI